MTVDDEDLGLLNVEVNLKKCESVRRISSRVAEACS